MTELITAIKNRRSIGKVTAVQPEREKIEQILEAGLWAPNHHRTEPWRFIVLEGEGRERLAQALAAFEADEHRGEEEERKQAIEKGRRKAYRAPYVIVVICEPKEADHVEWIEEIAACACAAQNMLLAAHSLGLGAMWRTGKAAYHERVKEAFNVSDNGAIVGFIYVGYPDVEPKNVKRMPLEDKVEWWSK